MTRVAVIIVNWNTAALLDRCLRHLLNSRWDGELEVWVIDNASEDDSLTLLERSYPQVHVIKNDQNVGFSRANNQGIAASSGDYYLLLNSDAFLQEDTLGFMVSAMENFADTGILGCQLFYENGELQRSCQSFPTLSTELWQCFFLDQFMPGSRIFGKYMMTYWKMDDFREVDVVMGAVMLVRREAIEQVGVFDEQFFMYSEEVDLCYRMKQKGWKTRYLPEAKAVHIWGGSSARVPTATLVRLYRSRAYFFRKAYGKSRANIFKLILLINSGLRWLGGNLLWFVLRKEGTRTKANSYGTLFLKIWDF